MTNEFGFKKKKKKELDKIDMQVQDFTIQKY